MKNGLSASARALFKKVAYGGGAPDVMPHDVRSRFVTDVEVFRTRLPVARVDVGRIRVAAVQKSLFVKAVCTYIREQIGEAVTPLFIVVHFSAEIGFIAGALQHAR